MASPFEGKAAVVTGSGSGMGEAVARMLAERGANVLVADIDPDAAERVASDIGDRARAQIADVSDPDSCERMVAAAVSAFGRLDLAVNNAGIAAMPTPLVEIPLDRYRRMMGTHLDGVFFSMRAEIPELIRAGGGAIVNTTSVMGVLGLWGISDYVAAKHGIIGLTRNAAMEYSPQGVRVNCVGPGVMATPMTLGNRDIEAVNESVSGQPIPRAGRPEEMAELTCFLLSEAASYCTGAYYPVDGGWSAQLVRAVAPAPTSL